ncbi:Dihydroneopterin aldolase [compost metagenome]
MGKITFKNIVMYGYHGVLESEKSQGQLFQIDFEAWLELEKASETDSLDDTINYAKLYELIKESFFTKRYDTLEALGGTILKSVGKEFPGRCSKMAVKIRKPMPPIPGVMDYVEVELRV